jgi:hypothetical protein
MGDAMERELIGGGLLTVEAYAVRIEGGDVAPLGAGTMMQRTAHECRDHRTAAIAAFRAAPTASHVFTCATGARVPLCVCWRRVALLAVLGEVDQGAGGVS